MPDLAALVDYVESVVKADEARKAEEEAEKYEFLTQYELSLIPNYQSSLPTSPSPGTRYRKKFWRAPDGRVWTGPWEHLIGAGLPPGKESWPVLWFVYTVVRDPADPNYVFHIPKEVKIRDAKAA